MLSWCLGLLGAGGGVDEVSVGGGGAAVMACDGGEGGRLNWGDGVRGTRDG